VTDLANAVDLETAWLRASGDGLPALLAAAGGPWDTIQAYAPRTPHQQQRQIYVLRRRADSARFAQQRRMASHRFVLALVWPIGATTTGEQIAEDEQRAFDAAIDLLVTRVEGFVGDHTHGGRFLSVAESTGGAGQLGGGANPAIEIEYADPLAGAAAGFFTANVSYLADSQDYTA
jgi:hypothetical protein